MPIRAEPNDPWVGVHMLTEFIFCPRAGLLLYDQRTEDEGDEQEGEEEAKPRLDYTPLLYYELHALERELRLLTERLASNWKWVGIPLVLFGLTIVGVIGSGHVFAYLLAIFFGLFFLRRVGRLAALYWRISRLTRQYTAATNATAKEPDPRNFENQPIEWWQLIKAGFESTPLKERLRSTHMHVAGRPWRVLRRGSVWIPVFRKRDDKRRELRGQHYARMAAYCKLLEESMGCESPYGIVLFRDVYAGIAVAHRSRGSESALCRGLEGAREVIRAADRGQDPAKPRQGNPCSGCYHGKPFVHRPGETEHARNGKPLPVFAQRGDDSRPYHSACGDRFHWTPPHTKARAKGLINGS